MNLQLKDDYIPGTKLLRSDMGGVTGIEFLSKIFFISDGVMLTQIRDISGIDGSTLQNWTKRGWVRNSKLKKYNINQVAHILIINMLRSCMQLDKISSLIQYVNGRVDDDGDDIIEDSVLYDYICKIHDILIRRESCHIGNIRDAISEVTADYREVIPGAKERLENALEVIIVAYYASIVKKLADDRLEALFLEAPKSKQSNRRTDTDLFIDKRVTVIEDISYRQGTGAVKVNGQVWSARLTNKNEVARTGESVIVQNIDGVKLICRKIDK